MNFLHLDRFLKKIDEKNTTKRFFKIILTILTIVILSIVSNLFFPVFTGIIFNIIWSILLGIVIIFVFLGILIIVGLRKEASNLLDILLEGSLTIVDFIDFIKEIYKRFLYLLKEFVIYSAPYFGYLINFIVYILLIFSYKFVGKNYDVTILTVLLTIFLVTIFALLNKVQSNSLVNLQKPWVRVFRQKFNEGLSDGMEIMIFIFFLTMDIENLFFLPKYLHVPLTAKVFDYDLMIRGFVYSDHIKTTLTLIIIAISTEIVRNIIRLIVSSFIYYKNDNQLEFQTYTFSYRVKNAIRKSFGEAKDDLVIFVTYTTFLLFVFILFPRLKLLTLAVSSVTAFALDLFMPSRLKPEPKNDLIARTLIKIFRLNTK